MLLTVVPGVLCIGSAFPDPPFELAQADTPQGFDIDLTKAISGELGLAWRIKHYSGDDFDGIFDGLASGAWDCVASGATITPAREARALFCAPYCESGQSLVCNVARNPDIRTLEDLRGRIVGVQRGNTSEPVCSRLKRQGKVKDVRIYPYDGIIAMLDDLERGAIAAVMKLAPVMRWFTRDRPNLRVVQERITDEKLAISVAPGSDPLRQAIDAAQARLAANGTLAQLHKKWLLA